MLLTPSRRICQIKGSKFQHAHDISNGRSYFSTSAVQLLKDGFLDIALALPLPTFMPPYSSTIIISTVFSRLLLTLPISIWARRRQGRFQEYVLPDLKKYSSYAAKRIAFNMKQLGYKGTSEQLQQMHKRSLKKAVQERRKELTKEHWCSPVPTVVIPAINQLSVFLACTLFCRQLTDRPTPLEDESFFTLNSLTHTDPTGTLPIALGLVTLVNVETTKWFSKGGLPRTPRMEKKLVSDTISFSLQNSVQTTLRVLSIFRIVLGTLVDGAVIIHWITSATFGLLQTWTFNYLDSKKVNRQ